MRHLLLAAALFLIGTIPAQALPNMNGVWFELFTYADKNPIPCGTSTSAGRVLAVGYVDMNVAMHWNVRVDYVDHTKANGAEWYQLTRQVFSEPGVSAPVTVVQQIESFGDHTFRIAHSGDKNHVHDCRITRE